MGLSEEERLVKEGDGSSMISEKSWRKNCDLYGKGMEIVTRILLSYELHTQESQPNEQHLS